MALIQVKVEGKVVFSTTVEEVMHMFWDYWEELEDVDQDTATIDVVPE